MELDHEENERTTLSFLFQREIQDISQTSLGKVEIQDGRLKAETLQGVLKPIRLFHSPFFLLLFGQKFLREALQ